ncbi:MAG: 2Fe-2S iron-sulfur cluster binding domain-containing protein [Methylococcaceae bacterium]|nr:2Fe-2S iron-sulfur cluster binding domain-containing protein [Methylococcaceae bacterium]
MITIRYGHRQFEPGPQESVLECLERGGVAIPSSCRSGSCQTCLMKATAGEPPTASQQGLKDSLKLGNHFLACICHPTESLEVALPQEAQGVTPATVKQLQLLNDDIMQVALECHDPIEYRPGQFINLFRDPGLGRSYSIASVPGADDHLQLHVRRLPNGRVSGWIHDELRTGQTVEVRGPAGDCFYVPGRPDQPLLLIGTGSGLAPLYGIIRDALLRGHSGPIRLFHGSRHRGGLYLTGELLELTRQYSNFDYVPCISGDDLPHGHAAGRAEAVALQEVSNLKGWRVFLCGHPEMVRTATKKAFLAGASMKEIYADAFNVNQAA